jgi:hypothetical protein
MRVEGLKIIVELLAPPTGSYLSGDQTLLIEGFYRSGVVAYFVESLYQILLHCASASYSLASFELHLLMVSLGRVIQAKVIQVSSLPSALLSSHLPQEDVLFNPKLLCTLHSFLADSICSSEESKHAAEYILRELISHSKERAAASLGHRVVARYLPSQVGSSPSQREGKIVRQHSRTPPLSCAT